MEGLVMGVGRRRSEEQSEFWVAAEQLGRGPRNAFYDKLNEVVPTENSTSFQDNDLRRGCEILESSFWLGKTCRRMRSGRCCYGFVVCF